MLRAVTLCSLFLLAAIAGTVSASERPQLPPQPAAHPAGIPIGALRLSPCVAAMGEHWGDPKHLPVGPYYGVYEGKPVFTEIMLSARQLRSGLSYANLRALPGYTIDHVELDYEPHGHPGFMVPHYDLHAFYVSPAVEAAICPHGVSNPALKATNF